MTEALSEVAAGSLVVRASGAAAAARAMAAALHGGQARTDPDHVQVLMRATLPRLPPQGVRLAFGEASLEVRGGERHGVVLLTVAANRLSVGFGELRPLLFQPVPVTRGLQALFSSSIAHLLAAADTLDTNGARAYLTGLAELVLRTALRTELDRADAIATRRRDAVDYIRLHLADPALTAERIADALFISRRRLYQLFDDGDGVSGRIRAMRVERAKELLADPAQGVRGIGEISRQCGFANAAHFSRTFRKSVGQTPRDYRESVLI
ncbi:helix-turn-helix domain-containing protein [Actinokineospora sp. NBRC 105648]|uniref:helix-turn-helix transcriptional regulator n=1 Tax=Actinokineospora sp. NBRC 105648 TaxID=3032206 RepID=UPI002554A870|nr:helix-turn-helix domain-containing protein [Actinokineospora sp. NBRC 105648]